MPAKGAGMEELQTEDKDGGKAAPGPPTPASQRSSGEGNGKSPMYSCISGASADNTTRERFDSDGTPISKRSKQHHLRFIDEVKPGAKIAHVREVKSFKKSTGCGCSLM